MGGKQERKNRIIFKKDIRFKLKNLVLISIIEETQKTKEYLQFDKII